MPIGGLIGAGVASAGISAVGNYFGQKAQAGATSQANQTLWNMFGANQQNLSPFIGAGTSALSALQPLIGTAPGTNPLTAPLTKPFQPTIEQLKQTPGYEFLWDQGEQGVANSFAAKGLGSSGAALKGAADYTTGLADTTYQQQFQNYLTQNQQIYNMLTGQVGVGANAANALAGFGTTTAGNVANNITGLGNATAGAFTNTANTAGGALTNIASMNLLQSLIGGGQNISPSIIAALGNTDASQVTDAQSNAYGTAMGFQ